MHQISSFASWSWLAACIVLLALGPGCAPRNIANARRQQGMEYYVQATQFDRAGQRNEAIQLLEKAVASNPDLRMARTKLGDVYRAKGDYQRAATHYAAAAKLDPYTPANHYNLGLTYQFLNRLPEAAIAYLKALKLNPRDVKTNMNLGLVYLALGQLDDANVYLERATQLDPKYALAWSNLGVVLDARGQAAQAEVTYRKSLELDSRNLVTLQNLAQNLMGQGKATEALSIMEQVVARSDSPGARRRYGDALATSRRYDGAIQQYDLSLKAEPNSSAAMTGKGFALIGKYVDGLELDDQLRTSALALWQTSVKINPAQPRVYEAMEKWQKRSMFGQ